MLVLAAAMTMMLAQPPPGAAAVESRIALQRQQPPKPRVEIGAYTCLSLSGRPLDALSFRLLGDGRYVGVRGELSGTYEISEAVVHFTGGHLAGETAHALENGRLKLGVELCVIK